MRFSGPVDPSVPTVQPAGTRPQPMFVYVAVLSDKQRKTMLADAFAAAKRNAAELAEAAGMKLGAIADLQGNFSNSCLPGRRLRSRICLVAAGKLQRTGNRCGRS